MEDAKIPEFQNSVNVLNHAREKTLLTKLLQQLQKDFSKTGLNLDFNVPWENETLIQIIKEEVYRLLLEKFDNYLALLYVIDIAEKEFAYVDGNDAVEVSGQVTFLILKREFQKVWYKNKYR